MKKLKNWHFSKGVKPWFWFKNGHFSDFFFRNIQQENVFYDILKRKNAFLNFFCDILERENAFLGYKNKKFKKSTDWHFSKAVNPPFWFKNLHFSQLFFVGNIQKENVFYGILEQKNACLGYEKKKFKKSKNWHFSKGVNPWFWSKNGHFSNFFFSAM